MGKRILQDDGFWLRTLRKPNVELVRTGHRAHRPRRSRDGRRHGARSGRDLLRHRLPPQRLPRADGGHRSPRRVAARAVGRRAERVPRCVRARTSRTSSACTARAPTWRTARACSSTPSTRRATRWTRSTTRWRRAGAPSRCGSDVHDRYAAWHQEEISQLVWAHPSIAHSHYKNPAGQGVHAVAVADRPVLGAHPRTARRGLSAELNESVPKPHHNGAMPECKVPVPR